MAPSQPKHDFLALESTHHYNDTLPNKDAQQIAALSLQSTRQMMQMCEESGQIGAQTMETLLKQAEQLESIETHLVKADDHIKGAHGHLNVLRRSFWIDFIASVPSLFGCTCDKGDCDTKENQANSGSFLTKVRGTLTKVANISITAIKGKSDKVTSKKIEKVDKCIDATEKGVQVEFEIESNLDRVEVMMSGLRSLASEMNSEVGRQNEQVQRITEKADDNDCRLHEANLICKRLL